MAAKFSSLARHWSGDAVALLVGTAASALLGFAATIYAARTLGPAAYGTYAAILASIALFVMLSDGGINILVIRDAIRAPETRHVLYARALKLRLLFGAVGAGLLIASTAALYASDWVPLAAIASVAVIFSGTASLYSTLFNTESRFRELALYRFLDRAIISLSLLVSAAVWGTVLAVVVGTTVGTALGATMWIVIGRRIQRIPFNVREKVDWGLAKAASIFGAVAVVTFLVGRVSLLFSARLTDPVQLGYIGIAFMLSNQAFMLVENASTALFPRYVRASKHGIPSLRRIAHSSGAMGLIGAGVALAATVIGIYGIPVILGPAYEGSIPAFIVLMWTLPLVLASVPVSLLADSNGKQHMHLINGGYMAIVSVTLLALLVPPWGAIGAAIALLAARCLGATLGSALILRVLKSSPAPTSTPSE